MDFKEYEKRREAITNKFVTKAAPFVKAKNIKEWHQLRLQYRADMEALYQEWQPFGQSK